MRGAFGNLLTAIGKRPEYRHLVDLARAMSIRIAAVPASTGHLRGRPIDIQGAFSMLTGVIASIRSRAKIHHFYFILASFDLVAVLMGLYLSHNLNNSFAAAVGINQSWNQHFSDLENMRRAMNRVATAKYTLADSENAETDIGKLNESIRAAHDKLVASKAKLYDFMFENLTPNALQRLDVMQLALQSMLKQAERLTDHKSRGIVIGLPYVLREIDKQHYEFLTQADALLDELRRTEHKFEIDQFDEAQKLRKYEYVIGLMIVLMVVAVTLYGHRLSKLFQQKYDELELAHGAARKAEAEARTYAEQLQSAHEHVTNLNVELANNILKLKEAQDEIVRKGKLAQLGQLTATVAHEIRNPLGAVRTAAFLVERKVEGKGLALEKQIERINNGIKRCDKIITELLDFARSKSLLLKTTAVDGWVRKVVEEEAKNLPPAVQIAFDMSCGNVEATFDLDRMQRVLINLLSNAAEAMVGKGKDLGAATQNPRITITTRRLGGNVEITVTDNGPGISEENKKKILEPLFTTKSFGVGLGLPAVEKILEQHGGGLKIASNPGEGASITGWFPFTQHGQKKAA